MRPVYFIVVFTVFVLCTCQEEDAPDFTMEDCSSEHTTNVLNELEIDGMKAGDGSVDPPEEGESFFGLTCIAYNILSDSEVAVGVINYWLLCQEHVGFVSHQGENNYEISLDRETYDFETSCTCPFDFTYTLRNVDVAFPTLTLWVHFASSTDSGYEATFQIAEESSGIQCWENSDGGYF